MIWALHGAVGSSADWRGFAREIRTLPGDLGEVRRLDLWRFLDCCPMPLEKFGNTLAEEIIRIDPAPVLLGYSMGGRLVLHALLAQPELWKAAIIVSAHPGLGNDAERAARRERDAQWSALALKGKWSDFLGKWNAQSVLGGSEMPGRSALKERRTSIARSFVDWSLGVQKDLKPRLHEIPCPVLWMTGECDEKFSTIARSAVPLLLHGEHQMISSCGHRVPWEKPEEFAGACRRFLGNALET